MAAATLAIGTAVTTSACLITDVPDFPPPERTPPFLIAASAQPALNVIHLVKAGASFDVSAVVLSEDAADPEDPDASDILYSLLIDYGTSRTSVYRTFTSSGVLEAGTFDTPAEERTISASWPGSGLTPGCHTFTLMTTHAFRRTDPIRCPQDLADSSQLTWTVYVCPDAACDVEPSCPALEDATLLCTCPADPDIPDDAICPIN